MEIQVVTVLCIQITRGLPQSGLWICFNGKQFFQSLSTYAHSTAGIHKPGALELKTFGLEVIEDTHASCCPFCFLPKGKSDLRSATLLLSPFLS